jgi:hypothetical protein
MLPWLPVQPSLRELTERIAREDASTDALTTAQIAISKEAARLSIRRDKIRNVGA